MPTAEDKDGVIGVARCDSRVAEASKQGMLSESKAAIAGEAPSVGSNPTRQRGAGASPGASDGVRVRPPPREGVLSSAERDSIRRRALAAADLLALTATSAAVWLPSPPQAGLTGLLLSAALPLWILLHKLLGLYDRDANVVSKSTLDEWPRILQSVVLGSSAFFLIGPLLLDVEVGRVQTLAFMGVALVLLPLFRSVTRRALNRRAPAERCLIVGSGRSAVQLAAKLVKPSGLGVALVGFINDSDAELPTPVSAGPPARGGFADFERLCADVSVERVIIAHAGADSPDILRLLRASKELGLKVSVVPGPFEAVGDAVEVEQLEGITLLGLRGFSRTGSSLKLKRAIDFAGAAVGLIFLAPLMLLIATLIRLETRGPALFAQSRIGRHNRAFRMFKFRTMELGAEHLREDLLHLNEATEPMFKIADDPRLTRVGRVLRRYSLDELPQLWNVLRGEMSLVGPRPLVPDEDAQILGPHRARLDLTPGLTGPWQVLGRTRLPFEEMIRLDYIYVTEWSLWNDFKLLLRTAPIVLSGRGH